MATQAWSIELMAKINAQVAKAMKDVQTAFDDTAASYESKNLGDILGASDEDHWWRLYNNLIDWSTAQANPRGPRMLYDTDDQETFDHLKRSKAKGYHEPIVKAYERFLKRRALNDRLKHDTYEPLTHTEYIRELFETARAVGIVGPDGKTKEILASFRMASSIQVTFTASQQIDKTLFDETFKISDNNSDDEPPLPDVLITLVKDGSPPSLAKRGREEAYCVWDPKKSMQTAQSGDNLEKGIDQVFRNFHDDMKKAKLRKGQLRAIARAIRNLHIMHAFTDACGRTNIFLLLPMMLLCYGFGLPLGGEHGGDIDREAIMMMFNEAILSIKSPTSSGFLKIGDSRIAAPESPHVSAQVAFVKRRSTATQRAKVGVTIYSTCI